MKMTVLVVLALVAIAAAAPADLVAEPVKILRSLFEQQPNGEYQSDFETENGIKKTETGVLKEVVGEDGKPVLVLVVRGTHSYVREDGTVETINYSADEEGFHADGDSIPKQP